MATTTAWDDYVDRTCSKAPFEKNGWRETHPVREPAEVKAGVFIIKCQKTSRGKSIVAASTNSLWAKYKGPDWQGYKSKAEALADALVSEIPRPSPSHSLACSTSNGYPSDRHKRAASIDWFIFGLINISFHGCYLQNSGFSTLGRRRGNIPEDFCNRCGKSLRVFA